LSRIGIVSDLDGKLLLATCHQKMRQQVVKPLGGANTFASNIRGRRFMPETLSFAIAIVLVAWANASTYNT
jgi:hypothetical protein